MSEAPTIVVTGMCNTKGVEIRFLAEQVAEHGGRPLVMDLSLGGAVDWADISLHEVLAATRHAGRGRLAAPRAAAIGLVGHAGAVKILELHAAGRCDGITRGPARSGPRRRRRSCARCRSACRR